jgi:hypothetical protein
MSNLEKTPTYQKQLKEAAFEKYGSFHYETTSNKISYKPKEGIVDCKQTPKVYVWLHLLDNEEEIIYVGKTKYSITGRMAQHRQGFKGKAKNGSVSGSKKQIKLIEILEKNHSVEIWARKAENRIFEIKGIDKKEMSHLSVEEEFFIDYFKPDLNESFKKTS